MWGLQTITDTPFTPNFQPVSKTGQASEQNDPITHVDNLPRGLCQTYGCNAGPREEKGQHK